MFPLNKFFKLYLASFIICSLYSCSGHSGNNTQNKADSLEEIDSMSLTEEVTKKSEQSTKDSIEQEILKADTLKERHILVDKNSFTLYLLEESNILMKMPVCLGERLGQKQRPGDHKTPEGKYKIGSIENSSEWTHDSRDGKGKIKGCYGPWFFRLTTPQSTHIGIHGTDEPETMGQRASEGCIRVKNEDIIRLKEQVKVGMIVIINPDKII